MAQNLANLMNAENIAAPSVLALLNNSFAAIRPDLFAPGNIINPGIQPGLTPGVLQPGVGGATTPPTGSQTVLPRVRPGDVITADLINVVLEMLETLAAGLATQATMFGPNVAALRLGNLAQNTRTLLALGTGFEANGGIFLDGQPLLSGAPTRGVNLAILDAELNVKHRRAYDTFAFSAQAELLASDLMQLTDQYDVVIGMTSDAFSSQLTNNARAALASVGAEALGQASRARDNAAFIGVVPAVQERVSFNFLASVLPADAPGTGNTRLAAQPFAWGLYSRTLRRFLIGGATGNLTAERATQPGGAAPAGGGSVVVPLDPRFGIALPRDVLGVQSVSIIKGIGEQRAASLQRAGVTTLAQLSEAQPEQIAQIGGVGVSTAQNWISQAQALLHG
jgi:hypothetical protein